MNELSATFTWPTTGYNCYQCGIWVTPGVTHVCNAAINCASVPVCPWCGQYTFFHYKDGVYKCPVVERITSVLERLVEKLDV